MAILFIGKRFYTNRDAYAEKYGRIYQLPYYWSKETSTSLWLIDYHTKEKIKDQHDNLNILSIPLFSAAFIFTIIKIILVQRPKTIVASGDCYIGLLSYLIAKLCGAKFVFDIYDKYDSFDGYRNLGFKNLFHFLMKHADICLFASKKLKNDSEYICKTTLLTPNGIDTNHFYPRDKNQSREFFNLDTDKIYIGYFGSMEIERGIDDLISAVKVLHEENNNFFILLGGKKREDLNLEFNFIHYLGNVPFKDVPIAMACCDVLTLPYRNSEFLDNAASCKIGEYLSLQIPICATKTPNFCQNHEAKQNLILAEQSNTQSLANAIKKSLEIILKKNPRSMNWEKISDETLTKIISL